MSNDKGFKGDAAGSGPRSPEYSSLADARSGVLPPIAIAPAHTPGPWKWTEDFPNAADKNELLNERGRIVLSPVTSWDGGTCTGAGIRTGPQQDGRRGMTTDETAANARLIAAAPELLAALIAIRKVDGFNGWHNNYRDAIELAEAAIAKATSNP